MSVFRTGEQFGDWTVDNVLSFGKPLLLAVHGSDDPSQEATVRIVEHSRSADMMVMNAERVLRNLKHPAFPKVIEVGESTSHLFIAFESFRADSLADRMAEGRVDWKQACTWLYHLAKGLQHLHHQGFAHRGLSPEAVFVTAADDVRILGLHSATGQSDTRRGLPQCNMTYVAPEVLARPDHDAPRADLYAFGCVAYELLAGESPFPAAAWADDPEPDVLLHWKTRGSALDPGPDQPEWVRMLVRKCTHPQAEHRLPDIDTVVMWLEGSRASWQLEEEKETPAVVPRGQLPTLTLQPRGLDPEALALSIARHTADLQAANQTPPDYRSAHDMLVIVAAALGAAAGLSFAVLGIVYLEISNLV